MELAYSYFISANDMYTGQMPHLYERATYFACGRHRYRYIYGVFKYIYNGTGNDSALIQIGIQVDSVLGERALINLYSRKS